MFDESTLQRFVAVMNRHLPTQRRLLVDLLQEKEPFYEGKDGNHYKLDKAELLYLDSLLDFFDKGKLRLPILVMTDTESESGAWKVTGKVEAKVIAKVLERDLDTADMVRFYYPHLHELRKKLPTTTTVMFMP
jgi:uncharacterized protein (UPF0216 family)